MNCEKTFANTILIFLVLFVGCSLFESEDSSQIRLSIQGNTNVLRRVISVNITTPRWSRSLTGTDFGTPEAPNYTQTSETPNSGNLDVYVILKDSLGNHANAGSISLTIRPDWIWEVDIVLDNDNPFYSCFGCVGYRGFGVDSVYKRAPEDSLFIVWGGNSIEHPVIY